MVTSDADQDPSGQFAGTINEPAPSGLAEEGSQTGLGIGFDAWASGAMSSTLQDVIGMSIRVDGQVVAQLPVPLTPGNVYYPTAPPPGQQGTNYVYDAPAGAGGGIISPTTNVSTNSPLYPNSLQTGALNTTDDLDGDGTPGLQGDFDAPQPPFGDPNYNLWIKNLAWAHFKAELTEDGKVKITWKGVELTPPGGIQTTFIPRPGRIVFGGRTGGSWLVHHVDNIRLVTIPADKIIIGSAAGFASGFSFIVTDSGPSVLDPTSLVVKLDGTQVPVTPATPAGGNTRVAHIDNTAFLASGSAHTLDITAKDTRGIQVNALRNFTVQAYGTVPSEYAVASATTPGFSVRVNQIDAIRQPGDENSIPNAEQQAVNGMIDPATLQPYPNTADLSQATGGIFAYNALINWNVNGAAYGQYNNPADIGNFRDVAVAPYNIADTQFPGMPGAAAARGNDAATDSFIDEIVTYLHLTRGTYRMGVNSDDGFKVTVSAGVPNPFGLVLGSYGTGRGSSDSLFDFVVTADGYYPFRLLMWQGGGGGNLEWFNVDLLTGQKILINDTAKTGAVAAFQTATGRAYVKSILPADGYQGAQTNQTVIATLVDGSTTVSSASLVLDGNTVASGSKSGNTTTLTYALPPPLPFGSVHSGSILWTESTTPATLHTNNFTFTVRLQNPDDLPANSFWIEAEDFDATGTAVPAAVNTMPYDVGAGGANGPYDGIGATFNVDYNNNDSHENTNPTTYRSTGDPDTNGRSVDLTTTTGRYALRRPGKFDMTLDYRIGWVDSGEWYNYTRNVPAGVYTAFAAISHGDPAGTPDRLIGRLSIVTAGVGTLNQTLQDVGSFNAPSSGAWGDNNLVPMKGPDGTTAYFKVGAGVKTFRFTTGSGDYDWFTLVPSTSPPKVVAASPAGDNPRAAYQGTVKRNATIDVTINDLSTAVVTSSVKVKLDGADVTAGAAIAKNGDVTTIHYAPASVFDAGSTHTYSVDFTDNGTPPLTQTYSATFNVNVLGSPGQFLIEAEDFDTGGGQTQTAASTMPYTGNAYNNLAAVHDVDYHSNDGNDSDLYRKGESPNVNMDQTGDTDRGTWNLTVNYKIGWVDTPDWQNYSRNFPNGNYQIWAALSYDNLGGADLLAAKMELVNSGVGSTNQTLTELGTFDAPGTGGWGVNRLVPMKDSGGNIATVALGGAQTLRYTPSSGDTDYFLLVPGAAQLRFNTPTLSGGTVTISWTGTATVQQATALTGQPGDWSDLSPQPAGNSFTVTPGAAAGGKYYRLKQ